MDFVFRAFFLQFLLFGMLVSVVRPQTGGTDCRGRDYLCLDDVRFQLCVDYGDGQPKTVNDEVQWCPQGTFCSNSGHFECDSFVPPSTTAEPQVDEGQSETGRPEDGPVSSSEPEPTVEEATTGPEAGQEETEEGLPNEPPTETATDGEETDPVLVDDVDEDVVVEDVVVEDVVVEEATDGPVEESSPTEDEVTTNENPVAAEESDVNGVVEDESVPEPTVASEAVTEQTVEEPSSVPSAVEVETTEDVVDSNPTTVEPSVEATTQSGNAENTEAPVADSTGADTAEEEKEVTTAPEVPVVGEDTNTESATEQAAAAETENPTEPDGTEQTSSAVPENTEPEATEETVEVTSAPAQPEGSSPSSASGPSEDGPTTDDSESGAVPETSSVGATEADAEEEAGTTQVPAVSDAPEVEVPESDEPEASSVSPVVTEPATSEASESTDGSVPSETTTSAAENSPQPETTEATTEATTQTTEAGPFVCQTAGRFPHPTDCHKYYICFWLPFGLYNLEQNCLAGFAYNPALDRCTADQSVCFGGQFTCTGPGRFPDPADPSRYYWCVWNMFGGYLQYNLQCPVGQVFNRLRARCTFPLIGRSLPFAPLDDDGDDLLAAESPEESSLVDQSDEPSDQSVEPASPSVAPATPEPTKLKVKVKFQCTEDGEVFVDPNNCGRYYVCTLKKLNKFKKEKFKCPVDQCFNSVLEQCEPKEETPDNN